MANLVELFDNIVQMQNLNGVPLANGKMYVYALGRTRLMDTWSDVDGESLNPNPIILDAAGQCHCYVTDDFDYTVVVTDEYNNEIFSIDKYLYSQGSHSHADVAVAPSETIAVSSYHVGETTVYVPYLTGQLGKVYQGIDPIVVNNTEDKISANHVPLGVQDPLYFVQDDEEGCIIGISGGTVPEGTMVESALGFENNKITGYNGSAFSAGNEYTPGDNIDITNGVISGKDWSSEINDASAAATAWTDSQGYLTGVDLSEYAKESFVISAIDSSTSGLLPTSAYATASGSFITALPDDLATTGFVAGVSADIVSQIPSTAGLATEQWVENKGYLTAVDIPESAVWNATTQTVSANSAQWAGGTANPQIPVTGINGIKISESADQVVFEVSANYATEDWVTGQGYLTAETDWTNTITAASANAYNEATAAIPAPFDPTYLSGQIDTKLDSAIYANDSGSFLTALPSDLVYTADIQDMATTGQVAEKLDTTAFSTVSGNFLTAHQSLADYQTTAGMTAYQEITGMTAYQPVGSYLSANALDNLSGNWETVTAKLDTTAFSDVSGTFLTAHQDISNKLDTTAFSDVSGSFLTAIPDTYLQNTDLSTEDGKVTAISGIPLSAGGDVPEGVMVESGLEYNAVNEISGYNGSAIAQYGAEKQWLQHDDTLVHAANSAQYALGVNLSAVAQLLGVDETVLWVNPNPQMVISNTTLTAELSDTISSYKKLRFICKGSYDYNEAFSAAVMNQDFYTNEDNKVNSVGIYLPNRRGDVNYIDCCQIQFSGKAFTANNGIRLQTTNNTGRGPYILSAIGIGRKEV